MKFEKNPAILLAGSVNSSRITLEKLIEHNLNLRGVLCLDPDRSANVSGYVDLSEIASRNSIPHQFFSNVNDEKTIDFVRKCKPDFLFVIGLSQMVREPLLSMPKYGCIGFHPTKLPAGRGRGAVAWLILGKAEGAATYFLMDDGMDSGPVLYQKDFSVNESDYANDVIEKIVQASSHALDIMLPDLLNGRLKPKLQNNDEASYLGKRSPEDGYIDWSQSSLDIFRLIRAVSRPLPGAYTYLKREKLRIWRAMPYQGVSFTGVPGSILVADRNKGILVQTGDSQLWLTECDSAIENFKVGQKLGINYELRIAELENEILKLKRSL